MKNMTIHDAYVRILVARAGSLSNPISEEYLRKLQSELSDWQGDIQMMLEDMRKAKIKQLPVRV